MCGGCFSQCCAYLLGSQAKWSNYVILGCGMIVTLLGLKMLASERNTICFLVLGLGAFTLLVASLGLWIADQPTSSRPCCSKLYSWMLLMLVLPQLAGHPSDASRKCSTNTDHCRCHVVHAPQISGIDLLELVRLFGAAQLGTAQHSFHRRRVHRPEDLPFSRWLQMCM